MLDTSWTKLLVLFVLCIFGLSVTNHVRRRFSLALALTTLLFLFTGCTADSHAMYATAHLGYSFGGFMLLAMLFSLLGRDWGSAVILAVIATAMLVAGCAS